jgi:tRNA G18 (ribose-2'-O)-methylase SpoU
LPSEVIAACDVQVRIPIARESLNAAAAAAIALYEASSRRSVGETPTNDA